MKDGTVIQMFPLRVACQSLLVVLWAISSLSTPAAAESFEFTDEFARFVPTCAGGCFVAFLESHYGSGPCEGSSSLSCLCAERGPTGFTVGEGAVQCVETESSIGLCRGGLAGDDDIERAYFMCSGQPGAVRPTHTALEATFVVTGTAGGVVLAPPPSTLVSSRSSTPSTTSTTASPTTSSFTTSTSRADPTSTDTATSGSSSSPAPTADESPSRDESQDEEDNRSKEFGTAQIVGLSVGVAAAAAILLVIFLLAKRRKKRYSSSRNSSALPIAESKRASSDDHPEGGRGNIFHISPPIHNHSPPTPAPAYSRGSWYPDAIGLAVSRPQSNAPPADSSPQRRNSRLLPPKSEPPLRPILTLNIPHVRLTASPPLGENLLRGQDGRSQTDSEIQAAQVAQLTAPPRAQANYRESTMTEFEEDGSTHPSVTAPPASSQIWRPPSSDPKSATTYYVADKNGNWVLGDPTRKTQQGELAELEAPTPLTSLPSSTIVRSLHAVPAPPVNTKAVSSNDGRPNHSPPSAPGSQTKPDQPGLLQLPLPSVIRTNADELLTRSSSVYSQSQGGDSQSSSGRNVPTMSFSHPEPPRHRSNSLTKTRSHKPGNSLDRLDRHGSRISRDSSNSVTTFASSSVDPEEDNAPSQDQTNLSPVAESPASGRGPSPATRDRHAQVMGHLNKSSLRADRPPPLRPSFHSPPGQPSPTLGMLQPAPSVVRRANRTGGMDVPPRHQGRSKLSTATTAESVTQSGPRIMQPPTSSRPDPSQFRSGSPLLPTMRMVPQSRVPSSSSPYPEPLRLQRPQRPRPDEAPPAAQHAQEGAYQGPSQQQRGSPSASHFHRAMWGPERHSQQHQHHWRPQPPHLQGHPALQPPQDGQQQQQQQLQERLRLEQHLRQPQYRQDGPYPSPATHYHQQQQPQLSRPSLPAQSSDSTTASSYCSSSSSSLATKRVGNERAAALSLQRARDNGGSSERWQREAQEEMSGGLSDMSSWQGSGSGQLSTPSAAGWQPRLTPTRRGDDLYLNVH